MAHPDIGVAPLTGEPTSLEALVGQYEARLNQAISDCSGDNEILYQALLARDQIAASTRDGGSQPPLSLADRICPLDEKLKKLSTAMALERKIAFEGWRDVVQPPEQNWWWHPKPAPKRWLIAPAVLLLTGSATLVTDFARRILSADPDGIGISSIAIQAILAVAATSTFTESGRQSLEGLLSFLKVRPRFRPWGKFAAAVILFALVFWGWKWWPAWLASSYNNRAYQADMKHSPGALELYKRAIALNPQMPQAHFNLGEFYERIYQYDKATAEYQQSILVDPSHITAYANLSRLLILANQPLAALRVAVDGVNLNSGDAQTRATLNKDLAWAEEELGFYSEAEVDAESALQWPDVKPAAYCVLGKTYARWGKKAEAQQAWKSFTASIHDPKIHPPIVEPDCTRLAKEASDESK